MQIIIISFCITIFISLFDIVYIRASINKDLNLYEETKNMNWEETIHYINNNVSAKKVDTTIQKIKFLREI